MENFTTGATPAPQNNQPASGTPNPFKKMVLALVALLVVGGVGATIYLNSAVSPATTTKGNPNEPPPSLSVGGGGIKGSFVGESTQGFLQYEAKDVTDFDSSKAALVTKFGTPGIVKGNAATNYMSVNADGMTMADVVNNYNPKAVGNRALFIMYSSGKDGLSKGFHTYPAGPFGTATTEIKKDDLSKVPLARNSGVVILSRSDTEIYGVLDPATAPSGSYAGSLLPDDKSGWVLVSGNGKLSDLIGASKDRIISAWALKDATTFEKVDMNTYSFSTYHMAWLNLYPKSSISDATPTAVAPKITKVDPTTAVVGQKAVTFTITGSDLGGAQLAFTPADITNVTGLVVDSTNTSVKFVADIAPAATLGLKEIKVTTTAGSVSDKSFEVKASTAPVITSISPLFGIQGEKNKVITITGNNLVGATVVSASDLELGPQTTATDTKLTFKVNIDENAPLGLKEINVVKGSESVVNNTFEVKAPAPKITSISPSSLEQGQLNAVLVINGTSLTGAEVTLSSNQAVNFPFIGTPEVNDDGTVITINDVNVAAAAAKGFVKVTVKTPYGTVTDAKLFSIVKKGSTDPVILSVAPLFGTQGENAKEITITGTSLLGATVTAAQDMTIVSQTPATKDTLKFIAKIAADAPIGTGKVITVTKDSVSASNSSFEIKVPVPTKPTVTSLTATPASVLAGGPLVTLVIKGTGLKDLGAKDLTGTNLSFIPVEDPTNSDTSLTIKAYVDPSAAAGARALTITNAGGSTVWPAALTVGAPVDPGAITLKTVADKPSAIVFTSPTEGQSFTADALKSGLTFKATDSNTKSYNVGEDGKYYMNYTWELKDSAGASVWSTPNWAYDATKILLSAPTCGTKFKGDTRTLMTCPSGTILGSFFTNIASGKYTLIGNVGDGQNGNTTSVTIMVTGGSVAQSTADASGIKVGDTVLAMVAADSNEWKKADVSKINSDNTYDVKFKDNATEVKSWKNSQIALLSNPTALKQYQKVIVEKKTAGTAKKVVAKKGKKAAGGAQTTASSKFMSAHIVNAANVDGEYEYGYDDELNNGTYSGGTAKKTIEWFYVPLTESIDKLATGNASAVFSVGSLVLSNYNGFKGEGMAYWLKGKISKIIGSGDTARYDIIFDDKDFGGAPSVDTWPNAVADFSKHPDKIQKGYKYIATIPVMNMPDAYWDVIATSDTKGVGASYQAEGKEFTFDLTKTYVPLTGPEKVIDENAGWTIQFIE